jgi:hypothetical protein
MNTRSQSIYFNYHSTGVFKRGWRPSFQYLPLPLAKGKGIQGMGSPIKKLRRAGGQLPNSSFMVILSKPSINTVKEKYG